MPYYDVIIIDGIKYSYTPGKCQVSAPIVKNVSESVDKSLIDSIPRTNSVPVSNMMAMQLSYDESDFMPVLLRDHLTVLFETQKPFWIQYDDKYAFDNAVCSTLDDTYTKYLVPMRSIVRYDYVPGVAFDFMNKVKVNGVVNNNCSVDSALGLISFTSALNPFDVVSIEYTFRMYGRIISLAVKECEPYIAKLCYSADVTITEMKPTSMSQVARWLPSYTGGLYAT